MRSSGLAGCVLLLTALLVFGTSADAGSESLTESGPTQKSVEPQRAVGERKVVPGTRFSLVPPAGFEPSGSFTGFEDRVNYARIVVLQHPIPFDELIKGFNEETFRERAWTLHRKEAVKVGENDGMLLFFTLDSQGVKFGQWFLLFGTESYTANVVAFFPEAQSAKFSEALRQSVLSARLEATEPDPLANLPYTFEAPSKLKLWNRANSLLTYTKDGTVRQLQASEPSGPQVVIYAAEEGPAEAALSVTEFCAAASDEFISRSKLENIVLESPKQWEAEGIQGCEITGTAVDARSKLPLSLVYFLSFSSGHSFVLLAQVETQQKQEYWEDFRKVGKSLRPKKTGSP